MSKGNLFLGQARGSVGDITFTVYDGKQIARARNRQPRNPKVVSQMVSRIVLNTVSKAYSRMQAITDHSFESRSGRARNQQRFQQLNIAMLRDKLSAVIADPTEQNALDSLATSFSFKDDFNMSMNPYYISEGTLPVMRVGTPPSDNGYATLMLNYDVEENASYADVVAALGVQRGDQLTFIGLGHDYSSPDNFDQVNIFEYARIILEPASGDMSTQFIVDGELNDPNPKNEGSVSTEWGLNGETDKPNKITFGWDSISNELDDSVYMVGAAVILSRFEDGKWRRSSQRIVPAGRNTGENELNTATFGLAYASYLNGDSSGLYLNGSPTAAAAAPANQMTIDSVTVGGVTLEPGVGSRANLGEMSITGSNLSPTRIELYDITDDESIEYSSTSATALVIPQSNLTAGNSYVLMVDGEMYITLHINS